jgi:hypothetical protein
VAGKRTKCAQGSVHFCRWNQGAHFRFLPIFPSSPQFCFPFRFPAGLLDFQPDRRPVLGPVAVTRASSFSCSNF